MTGLNWETSLITDISHLPLYWQFLTVLIIWLVFVDNVMRALVGLLSLNWRALFSWMPTGRLRTCARTIGCKVITSAALALAFVLYFCVPYNKQLNNLDHSVVTGKPQTSAYCIMTSLSLGQYAYRFVFNQNVALGDIIIKIYKIYGRVAGTKRAAIITRWRYKWGDCEAGFHCSRIPASFGPQRYWSVIEVKLSIDESSMKICYICYTFQILVLYFWKRRIFLLAHDYHIISTVTAGAQWNRKRTYLRKMLSVTRGQFMTVYSTYWVSPSSYNSGTKNPSSSIPKLGWKS